MAGTSSKLPFKVSPEEWKIAKKYFKRNPHRTRLKKSKHLELSHYFIRVRVEGQNKKQIFAVQEGPAVGSGGFAKVKRCINENDEMFAVKIQGVVDKKQTKAKLINFCHANEITINTMDQCVQNRKNAIKNVNKNKKTECKIMKEHGLFIGETEVKYPKNTLFSPRKGKKSPKGHDFIQEANIITKKKFTVMPLYTGGTLKEELDWLDTLPLPSNKKIEKQLKLLKAAAKQMKKYNERGILHADIKAENFMLKTPHEHVRLIDFGIAKITEKNSVLLKNKNHQPIIEGTPAFMAPEIIKEGLYSCHSDLWALAKMLEIEFKYKVPGPLKDMMEIILNTSNPLERPSIDEFIATIDLQRDCLQRSKKIQQKEEMEQMRQFKEAYLIRPEVKQAEIPVESEPFHAAMDAQPDAEIFEKTYQDLMEIEALLQHFKRAQEQKSAKPSNIKNRIAFFEGLSLQRAMKIIDQILLDLNAINHIDCKYSTVLSKLTYDIKALQKVAQQENHGALLELCDKVNHRLVVKIQI